MAKTKEQTTTNDLPYEAVFAGLRGAILGEICGMPFVYSARLYFDAEGNPIPLTPEMRGKDPEEIPGFVTGGVVAFGIGDDVILPVWKEAKYQLALATGEFAKPEAKEMVLAAHKAALEADNQAGGLGVIYREHIAQLKKDLLDKDLLYTPFDGNFQEIKYEGS